MEIVESNLWKLYSGDFGSVELMEIVEWVSGNCLIVECGVEIE